MSTAFRYSSFTPDVHTGALTTNVPSINFAGIPAVNGVPSQFTVGGRVRIGSSLRNSQALMTAYAPSAGDSIICFQIMIDTAGAVSASFPRAGAPTVTTHEPLDDDQWHYVAVSFQGGPTAAAGGTMRLFVDGVEHDRIDNMVSPATTASNGDMALGFYNTDPLELAGWIAWSKPVIDDYMDIPDWFEPDGGIAGALAGAWDFSEGQVSQLGGDGAWHRVPNGATGAAFRWNVACARALPNSVLTLPAASPFLSRAAGAPFTLMAWIGIDPAAAGSVAFLLAASPQLQFGLYRDGGSDRDQAMFLASTGPGAATFIPLAHNRDFHLFAVTYDGNTVTAFADGTQLASAVLGGMAQPLPPAVRIGLNASSVANGCLQGVSLWDRALTPAEMDAKLAASEPSSDPDCLAWAPLATDFSEPVSGAQFVPIGPISIGEVQRAIDPASLNGAAAPATKPRRTRHTADPDIMRYKDFLALARSEGIDPANPPPQIKRDTVYLDSVAWFDALMNTANVDRNLQVRLRMQFARNLAIGIQLDRVAPTAGRFILRDHAGEPALAYHGPDGPQHVATLAELGLDMHTDTPGQHWMLYFQLVADCVALMLGALGAVVSAGQIPQVLRRIPRLETIADAIAALFNFPVGQAGDTRILLYFLVFTFQWFRRIGSLMTIIYDIIVGNWWSLALTVLSLVAQIVAAIVSAGWALAAKIAQMALAGYAVVRDIQAIIAANPALANPEPEPAAI